MEYLPTSHLYRKHFFFNLTFALSCIDNELWCLWDVRCQEFKSPNQSFSLTRIPFLPSVLLCIPNLATIHSPSLCSEGKNYIIYKKTQCQTDKFVEIFTAVFCSNERLIQSISFISCDCLLCYNLPANLSDKL